jgi:hypothetical protein
LAAVFGEHRPVQAGVQVAEHRPDPDPAQLPRIPHLNDLCSVPGCFGVEHGAVAVAGQVRLVEHQHVDPGQPLAGVDPR